MRASPVRFFLVVRLHSLHHVALLAGVTLIGLWTVWMSPGELDSALGMLIVVQMFLASTGFLARARRGQFDPILTSRSDRASVVASHWLASILPGVIAWALVSGVAWIYSGSIGWDAEWRRALALAIASVVAWTVGFPLTRGAAGMLWTATLVVILLHRSDLLGAVPMAATAAPTPTLLRHAAAVMLCPFLLLGTHPPLARGSTALAGCATAILLLAMWTRAPRLDFYLRERT